MKHDKGYVAIAGLICFLFSLTAPFAVPFALLFTKRDAKNLAWSWYDTPDEPELVDLANVHQVRSVYDRLGWFMAAWYWFGFRNRGHGFESLFAEEAFKHWPEGEGTFTSGTFVKGYFLTRKRLLGSPLMLVFGWQVYRSNKFRSGLEYRPKLSLKWRAK